MALKIGDINATAGMSKAIFDEINIFMSPPFEDISEEDMAKIRDGWRKLAYAIAKGVIDHIIANMEIHGIQTEGNINTTVSGEIDEALEYPDPTHYHGFDLSGEQTNVVFTQSNDGTGLVM